MTKIRIVVQSHLNDALVDMEFNPYMVERRIKFAKYLIAKYPDLNVMVDDEEIEMLWYYANELAETK